MTLVEPRVTQYTLSLLPEGLDALAWGIVVDYAGHGKWAVRRVGACLDLDGKWQWEPSPSNRDDEWLAQHRFDHDDAIRRAQEALPHVVVNGMTAADVLRRSA